MHVRCVILNKHIAFLSGRASLTWKSYVDASHALTYVHAICRTIAVVAESMPSRRDTRVFLAVLRTLLTARAVYSTVKFPSSFVLTIDHGIVGHPCRLDASTRSSGLLFSDVPWPPLSELLLAWCNLSLGSLSTEILGVHVFVVIVSNLYCYKGIQ